MAGKINVAKTFDKLEDAIVKLEGMVERRVNYRAKHGLEGETHVMRHENAKKNVTDLIDKLRAAVVTS